MLDSEAEQSSRSQPGAMCDAGTPEAIVAEIVAGNASGALYRSGKAQTFGWFVGQVMKKTGGRADPAAVREALTRALEGAPAGKP
jgi:aspartyl-tRNA(Asn)/glutamyl-tRNA(Gln) amidotransferase subunit B